MFVPPTYPAHTLDFTDTELDTPLRCLCGKFVKLRGALVCWTHPLNHDGYDWFTAGNMSCITARSNRGKTPGGQACALRSLTRSGRKGSSPAPSALSLAPR
jgi:hypothetical protein